MNAQPIVDWSQYDRPEVEIMDSMTCQGRLWELTDEFTIILTHERGKEIFTIVQSFPELNAHMIAVRDKNLVVDFGELILASDEGSIECDVGLYQDTK
jgi:hypothetical protein